MIGFLLKLDETDANFGMCLPIELVELLVRTLSCCTEIDIQN